MKKLLFLLVFISLISFGQKNESVWKNSMYEQYDYNNFSKLEIVNAKIDFDNINYDLFSASIFYATNFQRKKFKKKEFKYSIALNLAAQGHSEDMVNYDFYDHRSKVRHKRNLRDRMEIVGIEGGGFAENIHNSFAKEAEPTYWSFASSIVQGWMNSKGHRGAILNTKYKYLGCGVYYYVNNKWLDYKWVKTTQNFSSSDSKP
tara:strand:+ start:15 stop:623 length:609 start_codon:yes stop_codon:yes gene_type:complete